MTARRLRLSLVVAGVLLGALTLLSWTQPWVAIELEGGQELHVGGQSAAPALSALGLASLALAAALTIAGRVLRVVLGVVEAGIGVLVAAAAGSALLDPVAASASTVTDATAVGGSESIAALVASAVLTPWPWVAAVAGVVLAVAGLAVIATAPRWPVAARKYESSAATAPDSTVSDWDALSDGSDPTHR